MGRSGLGGPLFTRLFFYTGLGRIFLQLAAPAPLQAVEVAAREMADSPSPMHSRSANCWRCNVHLKG